MLRFFMPSLHDDMYSMFFLIDFLVYLVEKQLVINIGNLYIEVSTYLTHFSQSQLVYRNTDSLLIYCSLLTIALNIICSSYTGVFSTALKHLQQYQLIHLNVCMSEFSSSSWEQNCAVRSKVQIPFYPPAIMKKH